MLNEQTLDLRDVVVFGGREWGKHDPTHLNELARPKISTAIGKTFSMMLSSFDGAACNNVTGGVFHRAVVRKPMKILPVVLLTVVIWSSRPLSAANLLINLRSTSTNAAAAGDVASPYLTLSPGHNAGTIPLAETSWNNFSSTATSSSLVYGDGADATGVTLTFGTEVTAGGGTINFDTVTGINISSLYGTGGATAGRQVLVGNAASIYGNGNNSSNSAVGRAGWFGGGTATVGNALGLRVDGLAAGEYRIYVMARNTNSNAATAAPMNIYSTIGTTSQSFNFSPLTPVVQSNTTYANTNPTAYNAFVGGENFVTYLLTISANQSLFLVSDGGSAGETRGFLNMIQIVSVPEPSMCLLSLAGFVPLFRRRR